MSSFVLLVCIQACLIQNIFSQCVGYGGVGIPAMGGPGYAPIGYKAGCGGVYGGSGVGNIGVAGELPVSGTTAVAGQVPIMGAVEFGGTAPAVGAVTITGSCGCGCNVPYLF